MTPKSSLSNIEPGKLASESSILWSVAIYMPADTKVRVYAYFRRENCRQIRKETNNYFLFLSKYQYQHYQQCKDYVSTWLSTKQISFCPFWLCVYFVWKILFFLQHITQKHFTNILKVNGEIWLTVANSEQQLLCLWLWLEMENNWNKTVNKTLFSFHKSTLSMPHNKIYCYSVINKSSEVVTTCFNRNN